MTLRKKILSITVATFLVALTLLYVSSHYIILGGFAQLEQENINTNIERVNEALTNEINRMASTAEDWAPWDDTRNFILGKDDSYVGNNLADSTFANTGLNFMIFVNNSNEIVYAKGFDLVESVEVDVPENLKDYIKSTKFLLTHANSKDGKSGIVMVSDEPVLLSSWPASNSQYGPICGTFVAGKYFNDQQIGVLAERTRLSLTFTQADLSSMSDDLKTAKAALANADTFSQLLGESNIAGYLQVNDILGNPCLIAKVNMPRDIFMHGKQTSVYFISALFATCLVLTGVLFVTIQIVVLNPVRKLKDHFVQVAETDDMTLKLSLETGDEFGTLCKQFDYMVGKLVDARKTLMEQSYRSGISEMASGALHNVRNALTYVTSEIGCLANKINNTPLEHVQQAKDELKAGACDPQREHDLNNFIEIGSKSIFALVTSFRTGLADLTVPINRIEQMLADQDHVSHAEQPLEIFRIDELLSEVIKMMPKETTESISIELDETLDDKTMKANRISLVQIFSNLLLNSAESILQTGKSNGKITVKLGTRVKNGVDLSEFVVTDNGAGINGDDLEHIFESGFSTKQGKHSGLGLHWCANTLNATGGNIYAENCAEETGTRFHVLIPATQ